MLECLDSILTTSISLTYLDTQETHASNKGGWYLTFSHLSYSLKGFKASAIKFSHTVIYFSWEYFWKTFESTFRRICAGKGFFT